jgi:NADH dehydrogenase/NADH:ubiquinone oxidoreductase subunit G
LIGEDHNTDTLSSLISDPSKVIVYQGAHNQFFVNSSDVVLPSTSLLETAGLFVSFDGRIQKSNIVSKGLGEAKSHIDISSMFSSSLLGVSTGAVSINFFTPALLEASFGVKGVDTFIPAVKNLNVLPAPFSAFSKTLYYTKKQRFARTPYSASVFDFHIVNTLTRTSKLMSKCSQASRLNHKNFISS